MKPTSKRKRTGRSLDRVECDDESQNTLYIMYTIANVVEYLSREKVLGMAGTLQSIGIRSLYNRVGRLEEEMIDSPLEV